MYSTPTPMGRPSTFRGDAGGGGKLSRPPRVSMGTALTSPTLSTTSTRSAVMGRKSLSSSASASSSPVGSRSTSMTTNGSPETIRVGDTVRAPSGEVGTVKYFPHTLDTELTSRFVGAVKGKQGSFVGIDLHPEYQGKNDGSVAGIRYFSTSSPSSGMFLPLTKAEKIIVPSKPSPLAVPHPRARTISGTTTTNGGFVTPVGRPRQTTAPTSNVNFRNQSPVKSRF